MTFRCFRAPCLLLSLGRHRAARAGQSERRVFVGCVQQYCYCREQKHCPHEDPADFSYVIQVKENAPDPHAVGRRVRELCHRFRIADRMPRRIIPGDKRALNKRVVEALANQCHAMELDNAPGQRVWAYRKAAWAIEDLDVDIGLLYRQMGRKGLESIENVGPRLAAVVEGLLVELSVNPAGYERPGRLG